MLSAQAKHFYLRLHLKQDDVSKTLAVLRRTFERVVDCGRGTEEGPKDWWAEVRHPEKDAGAVLRKLLAVGLDRETIKQCCEVAPLEGHSLARQRPLFPL
jgi:hypothetical protein